jgi:hypothetical protein
MRFISSLLVGTCFALPLLGACGGSQTREKNTFVRGPRHVDVELPQLEINADGIDRYATCPPTGGVTQGWIPKIPPWSAPTTPTTPAVRPAARPPSATLGTIADDAGAGASGSAVVGAGSAPDASAGGVLAEGEIRVARRTDDPANAPTATERAIRDTLQPFRRCYHRGLRHDETQNGHTAIVVRVANDGRVAKTESFGTCELANDVVQCMMQVASRLRFDPPSEGHSTIIVPAVFAPRSGIVRQTPGSNDDYAAAAAIAIEGARPDLHGCEERERRAVRSRSGWGTFVIDIDDKGHAVQQNIDPWDGQHQDLLRCASDAMARIEFPPPPGGSATVRVRITFNPRGIE